MPGAVSGKCDTCQTNQTQMKPIFTLRHTMLERSLTNLIKVNHVKGDVSGFSEMRRPETSIMRLDNFGNDKKHNESGFRFTKILKMATMSEMPCYSASQNGAKSQYLIVRPNIVIFTEWTLEFLWHYTNMNSNSLHFQKLKGVPYHSWKRNWMCIGKSGF